MSISYVRIETLNNLDICPQIELFAYDLQTKFQDNF